MRKAAIALLFIIVSFCLHAQDIEVKNGEYYLGGQPYTGSYKEYYPNNNLSCELTIIKGKLNGKALYFYENGMTKETRSYHDGLKDGLWTRWGENGVKTAEASYEKDLKNGDWYVWDEKGQLRYKMYYKEGRKSGEWKMWDENGLLIMTKTY